MAEGKDRQADRVIKRNAVQCLECKRVIESTHRHDYRTCGCPQQTMVDGGKCYLRYGGMDLSKVKPLTEYEGD